LKNNPRNRVDVDRDESGIFKARNNNRDNNAKTIPDSHDMYIDKPVDYRNAKPVIQVIYPNKRQYLEKYFICIFQLIKEEIRSRNNNVPVQQQTTAKANSKQPPQQNGSYNYNSSNNVRS
jgi:hypothetical protein